ncbi:MAG: CAP domain-containing protein, partial [Clostridiales bacterium]|nr:CAP domain-containing protein [Clostridiales bacterium]
KPLVYTDLLHAAATKRARELEKRFSHDRPDGRSCFSIFEDLGINNRLKAENLAMKYLTPEGCVNGWMNSQVHKTIILHPDLVRAGVGMHQDASGVLYWSMVFTD